MVETLVIEREREGSFEPDGYVYVLEGGGYWKSGMSRSLNVRLANLARLLPFEVEDAATYLGGGFNVRVLCTNTGAELHAGGFGLARDYSITPDEARRVGLG